MFRTVAAVLAEEAATPEVDSGWCSPAPAAEAVMPPAAGLEAELVAAPELAVLTGSRGAGLDLDLEVPPAIKDALRGLQGLVPRSPLEWEFPLPVDAPSSISEDALSLGSSPVVSILDVDGFQLLP